MGFFSKFAKKRVSNTKTAFQLIVEDFRRYVLILKYTFLTFSVSTLIYSIVSNTGNLIINCALLGLLFIYTIADAILRKRENPNPSKKLRIIYAWLHITLNAFALASSLYALYSATIHEVKPITIVLATLSLIMFILKVVLEISLEVIQSKWTLLQNAMLMDAQEYPSTAGKIFAPFIGQDIEKAEVKESVKKRIKKHQKK